jgi:hypothetical protein
MRGRAPGWAIALAIQLAAPAVAGAQIAGANLLLGQVGNYPGYLPRNRQDLYDQLNLSCGFGTGQIALRFETSRNSEELYTYEGVTQRWAEWSDAGVRLRVGNFYTLLGRGLIHRSFELPGVVLDQIGIRSRYAFSREMDGALAEARAGPVSALLFSGTANTGQNSLAAEKLGLPRYLGQVSGAQIAGAIRPEARIGAAYLRSNSGSIAEELASGFLDLEPLSVLGVKSVALPLYFEYAQADGSFDDWWKLRRNAAVPHALYGSAGVVAGRLGVSAEWKDYAQFRKGINDPPPLVRETGYALLNRDTHVLDAGRETGYQYEVSYAPIEPLTITANLSRANGVPVNRYREKFAELRLALHGRPLRDLSVFADGLEDRVSSLKDGVTVGAAGTVGWLTAWSSRLDVERQSAVHPGLFMPDQRYQNLYVSLNTARAGWGSVALIWDRTSDPLVRSVFSRGGAYLHLVSAVVAARLGERTDVTLTAGRQRGGRACTAGTCYEVQPFEGAELRWVGRF